VKGFFELDPSQNFYKILMLMLGNVCCRYPEAVPFMIPPILLLPNLPHSPEYKGYPDLANIAISSNIRIIGASPLRAPLASGGNF
jgi:hypothetical protein